VDVVLLEGWMLGFNPLPIVPLPVYVNLSDPTAAEVAQQSAQPSTLQQTTQQLSTQQTRQPTTQQPAQQHSTQVLSAPQTADAAQQAHTVEQDGHTTVVLSVEQLAAEEARRAEFELLYNKANNIKVSFNCCDYLNIATLRALSRTGLLAYVLFGRSWTNGTAVFLTRHMFIRLQILACSLRMVCGRAAQHCFIVMGFRICISVAVITLRPMIHMYCS
jgi:hypothetical protein